MTTQCFVEIRGDNLPLRRQFAFGDRFSVSFIWCLSDDTPVFYCVYGFVLYTEAMSSFLRHFCRLLHRRICHFHDIYVFGCTEGYFDESFVAGCTEYCQNDNFRCSQCRKCHQNDDISFQCNCIYVSVTSNLLAIYPVLHFLVISMFI